MKKIKSNVLLIFIILIAGVFGLVTAGVIAFYTNFEISEKIADGVFIKGINVSRND